MYIVRFNEHIAAVKCILYGLMKHIAAVKCILYSLMKHIAAVKCILYSSIYIFVRFSACFNYVWLPCPSLIEIAQNTGNM